MLNSKLGKILRTEVRFMFSDNFFDRFILPDDLRSALQKCRSIAYIETQEELDELHAPP